MCSFVERKKKTPILLFSVETLRKVDLLTLFYVLVDYFGKKSFCKHFRIIVDEFGEKQQFHVIYETKKKNSDTVVLQNLQYYVSK